MFRGILTFILCWVLYSAAESLFDYSAVDIDTGNLVSLSNYRSAKVILVVNVASKCGFTPVNYFELGDIYRRYHQNGLEILAFPCNQFGAQEPGSNKEIANTMRSKGLNFPIFEKIEVNGVNAHPLYRYLKFATDQMEIPWNFAKFLVVNGVPVRRYGPTTSPKQLESDIVKYISEISAVHQNSASEEL